MDYSKLSNEELDRIIHEQVVGEHWHELHKPEWNSGICVKCHKYFRNNPRYCTSWEDYGRLLEKIKTLSEYETFTSYIEHKAMNEDFMILSLIINKRRGCEAIAEYFCKEGK